MAATAKQRQTAATAHTPGPWEAMKTKQIPGAHVARGWAISPIDGKRPILDIAQVHLSASQDEATQAANAALIAAAPDLLLMAKLSLRNVESMIYQLPVNADPTEAASLRAWRDNLREAIAKATAGGKAVQS